MKTDAELHIIATEVIDALKLTTGVRGTIVGALYEVRDDAAKERDALRAEVEAARADQKAAASEMQRLHDDLLNVTESRSRMQARLKEAERLLRQWDDGGNCHGATDVFLRGAPPPADSPVPAKKPPCPFHGYHDTCPCPPDAPAPSSSFLAPVLAKLDALEEWARQSYLRDHRLAEPIGWKGCHLCNGLTIGTCGDCEKRICLNHVKHCDTCKAAPPAPIAEPAREHHSRCESRINPASPCDCELWPEPSKPEAAGPVHTFEATPYSLGCCADVSREALEPFQPCGRERNDPIHATERK